jgi:MYXO-CTERM domain-containing protein
VHAFDLQATGTIGANAEAGGDANGGADPPGGGETGGGGGGAGGSVWVATDAFANPGLITADGGDGGRGNRDGNWNAVMNGGAGSDGLIIQDSGIDPVDPIIGWGKTLYVDAVRSGATAVGAGSVTVADAAGFSTGDEVLIIDMKGTGVGDYEVATIDTVAGQTLNLTGPLATAFDATEGLVVQVVPHYNSMTVLDGGTVTAHAWDGSTGGICAFAVDGLLDVQAGGSVNADGIGYRGGVPTTIAHTPGMQGESYDGTPGTQQSANFGGGGAGQYRSVGGDVGGGGGGGGYGGCGRVGFENYTHSGAGAGGSAYGDDSLARVFFGSGGGSGALDHDGSPTGESGAGGAGGGIVYVRADSFAFTGSVSADGEDGGAAWGNGGNETGGGGGGSGGSLYLDVPHVLMDPNWGAHGALSVNGGAVGADCTGFEMDGGQGGRGRMQLPNGAELDLPPLAPGVLLYDDFEINWGNDWQFVQVGANRMAYSIESVDIGGRNTHVLREGGGCASWDNPRLCGAQAVAGDETWTDYRFVGKMCSTDNDALGLLFRYTDADNFYRLSWCNEDTEPRGAPCGLRLDKVVGGTAKPLGELPHLGYYSNNGYVRWHGFEINVEGSRLQVALDGQVVFDIEDNAHAAGKIGTWNWANDASCFDDFVVYDSPSFLAHDTQRLADYEATPIFYDNFDDGAGQILAGRPGWWIIDLPGAGSAPSNWEIDNNGELHDHSNCHPGPGTTGAFGSLALCGDVTWTDYCFTGTMRCNDDDGFGVVFRYQDTGNFYRVLWSNDYICNDNGVAGWHQAIPRLRFDLLRDGVVVPIEGLYFTNVTDWNFDDNHRPQFTVECYGNRVAFWLDGLKLFEHIDTELLGGQVGVLQYGSADPYYDDLAVFLATGGSGGPSGAPVPEPAGLGLVGLVALTLRRRRRA